MRFSAASFAAVSSDGHLLNFSLFLSFSFGFLVAFNDLHAHFRQRGLNILNLIGVHLVGWQSSIELVKSHVTLALGLSDELFDRRLVKVDQRCVIGIFGF